MGRRHGNGRLPGKSGEQPSAVWPSRSPAKPLRDCCFSMFRAAWPLRICRARLAMDRVRSGWFWGLLHVSP
jgi:hypothetical protein